MFDIGLRHQFLLHRYRSLLRAQILNVFDHYAWQTDFSGTLSYSPSRRFRLVLTTEF